MNDRSIFLAVLEINDPSERSAYLDQACAGDPSLRRQVERLLQAHQEPGQFMERPAPAMLATIDEPPITERPGTVIGPYKLLEQIGEGGFGVVFMAEQQQPIRRKVALKILKPGMDTRQVVARFEAERQALALMDHPNIARVIDGGMTGEPGCVSAGRPYFVMELVKGIPITEFCDQHHLPVRDRLELFIHVCQSVQHAHQKGIIHRDLKPTNVMVAMHDDKPVVKVIDFGIAKAAGQQLTDKTLFTNFAQLIGTPLYMSPEQAGQSSLDADTRSDIYSLGVLLYELLTGTTPFEKERLHQADYDEIRRIIREEEPPKPSTRISTMGQASNTISTQRQSDPKKLSQLCRGELDWIVMKALEKDRNRRYETASAFAADVQRYLADEPVQACPPTMSYRLRKFLRRNKGPVLAASVFVFLLLAGILGTTTGLVRAIMERDEKDEAHRQAVAAAEAEAEARRQTRQALNTMTDEVLEDLLGRQPQLTNQHREFLKKVLAYHAEFAAAKADDPEGRQSRADGYFRVGRIRQTLGEVREAEAAIRDALALLKPLVAEFPTRHDFHHGLVRCYLQLGMVLSEYGGISEISRPKMEQIEAYREAVTHGKQLVAESRQVEYRRDLGRGEHSLAFYLYYAGMPEEAEPLFRDALAINKDLATEFPNVLEHLSGGASCYDGLAKLLSSTHRSKEADEAYREELAICQQLAAKYRGRPESREDLAKNQISLGVLHGRFRNTNEAVEAFREAVAIGKQLAAEFPTRPSIRSDMAQAQNNLGMLLFNDDQLPEAEVAWRDALALYQKLADELPTPEMRYQLALAYHNVGGVLNRPNRLKEAEAAYRDAVKVGKKLVHDDSDRNYRHLLVLSSGELAILLRDTGRPAEAEAAWREVLKLSQQLANPAAMAINHYHLGQTLEKLPGRLDEAIDEYREAIQLNKDYAEAHYRLADALKARGQPDEAATEYCKALGDRLAQLHERLPAVLERKDQSKDSGELLAFAQLCRPPYREHYAGAARFFGEAFAVEPKLAGDLQAGHRYNAACSAALAGSGQGQDADQSDAKERTRLRGQALDWLRADLEAWGRLLNKEPDKVRMTIVQQLRHWLVDTDFAGVRGPDALAKLPEAERLQWQKLWAEVEETLKKANHKDTKDTKKKPSK